MPLRYYPALLQANPSGIGFGVIFPDLPGCVSAGDTAQEASVAAAEALALHIEGMVQDGETLPEPSSPDAPLPDWLAGDDVGGPYTVALIPVEIPGKAVRANITMDEALLARLDAAAAAAGTSRSGLIAEAVRERLRRDRAA
jgi:predicted RNase H-like HicB family nuclease